MRWSRLWDAVPTGDCLGKRQGLLSHGQGSAWMSRLVVVKNGALQVLALSICSRI